MADETPHPDLHAQGNANAVTPVQARCLRCDHDLTRLPESARFCPRCGFDMLGSPPATWRPHQPNQSPRLSGLLGGWEHLFHIFHASGQSGVTQAPSPDATSLVVQGYGNALYRLGRRYEFGPGANSNSREALRCYSKSARLGNFWAMARLASHVFATKLDSAPDERPASQADADVLPAPIPSSPPELPPSEPAAH
jgi:TPR repeat protein